ncbi:TetR/AcrR family transcriptional regulator [Paraburkholderia silviterrae]|uniref:TetR/AcrR family transcriptional regulator n=1 Tax=Paraburkholderia silviterrae TaxID=2528715 RepID=A0A4R5M0S5_9BURK|nr:TetR/AcrR family transcriptional regulator [Paraburkholderia silviterrae]TDG18810.1 TetR/AcrR family transcriptional regulator [Paraburkholderia silviterrae]
MEMMEVEQVARPRAGAKRSKTEAAIKDAARRVFARDGFVNAKIGDIAEEAGKAIGSFYQYFKNKEELLLALADEFRIALRDNIRPPGGIDEDPFENLREMLLSFWQVYRQHGVVAVAVFQASMVNDSFASIWREIRAEGIRVSSTRIRLAQRLGYCTGVDPEIAGSSLCSMIEFTCYNWVVANGDLEMLGREVSDEVLTDTLTKMVVGAIRWQEHPST